MKNKDNVRILDHETIREDFTQHGLHLNATGEINVVKLMSQNISQLFEAKKRYPVILKWRTTHNDRSLANNIPIIINEDHVVIDNKGRNEDQIDSNNQGIRTSSRPKRFPNTRSDDFLCI
jgi:Cu/Ag efflux pump CusA